MPSRESQFGIDYGHFLALDDKPEERAAAKTAHESLRMQGPIGWADPVAGLEDALGRGEPFSSCCHAVITDLMFGDQPAGLSIALKALAEGTPCVVVSCNAREDGPAHLPEHARVGLDALQSLGIPVFLSDRGTPKRWQEGFERLGELLFEKWAKEESDMGASVRRHRNLWER